MLIRSAWTSTSAISAIRPLWQKRATASMLLCIWRHTRGRSILLGLYRSVWLENGSVEILERLRALLVSQRQRGSAVFQEPFAGRTDRRLWRWGTDAGFLVRGRPCGSHSVS